MHPDLHGSTKEIKTVLPLGHHLRLHRMKILTGKSFSDAIAEALAAYFAATAPALVAPRVREELPAAGIRAKKGA